MVQEAIQQLTKNPVAVLLALALAAVSGGSSGLLFSRPDPFTGTEGQMLTDRIIDLERGQALDDQHRKDAAEGYLRIRTLERHAARQAQATEDMKEEVKALRNDLSTFLRRLIIEESKP